MVDGERVMWARIVALSGPKVLFGGGEICELGKVTLLQNEQLHDGSSNVKFFFSLQYDGNNW